MAGVQGMPFTASGLPSSANKEKGGGGFYWDDAGSAEFFDQYVQLDDAEAAESGSGEGGGLGESCGASDLSVSPHLSFIGQMLPPQDGAHGAQGQHLFSADITINDDSAAASSSSAARFSRHARPQHAHALHRATSNMTAFSNPEVDGLPYGRLREAPGSGSISDSELLKLEGLTMRSPRVHVPQLPASEPASPPKSANPRKGSRLKSVWNKVCTNMPGKAKHAGVKPEPEPESSLPVPVMSTAQMEPARTLSGRPRPHDVHITKAQVPSPPLTSDMPTAQGADAGSDAAFVNGLLNNFMAGVVNSQYAPPMQLNGSSMPQTPLPRPLLGAWQLAMSTPRANPYMPAVNGDAWDAAWEPPADMMEIDQPVSYNLAANARDASLDVAAQLHYQPSYEYPAPPEDANRSFDPSDPMMYMPQPQSMPSAAAVLHSSDSASHRPTRADRHRRSNPCAPSSGARHHQYGPGLSPRKGRAVSGSSSASRIASVSPSPKMPTASLHRRSASLQTLNNHVVASSVGADGPASSAAIRRKRRSYAGRRGSSSSLHHQYHTLAVAAAAARGTSPSSSPSRRRTTTTTGTSSSSRPTSTYLPASTSSSSFSHHPNNHHGNGNKRHSSSTTTTTTPHHTNPEDGEPNAGAGAGAGVDKDGFVNYTPRDGSILMTGVAPSGSSKTKARREREAREKEKEKEREIRERVARMLMEAGGDVGGQLRRLGMGMGIAVGDGGGGFGEVKREGEGVGV